MRHLRILVIAVLAVAGLGGGLAAPTAAQPVSHGATTVSADPWNLTPFVRNGRVNAVAQVGGRVVVGGTFTDIKNWQGNAPALAPTGLFALDAATGAIDQRFWPRLDGEVRALVAAPDGRSVFVGGTFKTVNGVATGGLAKLDVATGNVVPIRAYVPGWVNALAIHGDRLFLGGHFDKVNGLNRSKLAAVSAIDGRPDLTFDVPVATAIKTTPWVAKLAVSPDGSKLVVIGGFRSLGGQPRDQVGIVDLTVSPARTSPWQTERYRTGICSSSMESYVRDVDISPDGSFMAIVTTGAWRGTSTLCDTVARFELGTAAPGQEPTWVDWTGGDTLTAVAISDTAVYTGGHQRWANNANTSSADRAGPGAVVRNGLAAHDPASGAVLPWNPGRDRGVGVFAMLLTPAGLWIGHDTNTVAGEWRPRITFFPKAGGATVRRVEPTLPADVYTSRSTGGGGTLAKRTFDGATASAPVTVSTGEWTDVRGAFMVNGTLYTGDRSGRLYARTFDGTTFGPRTDVATWTSFASMTGMFFANGRLYFTVSGDSRLYARAFTPETGVVGATVLTVSGAGDGLSWSDTAGMTYAGGRIYASDRNGTLRSVALVGGVPAAATLTTVSGPAIDGQDWSGNGMFTFQL